MKHYETQLNKDRLELSGKLWHVNCRDRDTRECLILLNNITEALRLKINDLEGELREERLKNNSPNPQYFTKNE